MTDFSLYSGKMAYDSSQGSALYSVGLRRLDKLYSYGLERNEPISHEDLSKANVTRLENWKTGLISTLDAAEKERFKTGFKRLEAAFEKVDFYWKHGTAHEATVRNIMASGRILSGEVVKARAQNIFASYGNTGSGEASARQDTLFVYFRVETHTCAMETRFGKYQFVVRTNVNSEWMNDSWITLRDMLYPYGRGGVVEILAGEGEGEGDCTYMRRTQVLAENAASNNAVVTGAVFKHSFTELRSDGNHKSNFRERTESVFEGAFYGPADIKRGIMLSLCRAMYELPPFWQEILDAAESDLPQVIALRLEKFFNIEGKVPVSLEVGPEVARENDQDDYKFKTGVSLPIWEKKKRDRSSRSKDKGTSTSQPAEKPKPPKYAGDYAGIPRIGAATQVSGGGLKNPSDGESDEDWNPTYYDG
ncbi:hypothetical protein D1823_11075 [Ruegeria sp. AD91A]|uniref:hypothetical protein n=1 Tax=Ruegeria sp. AD91A TaxID=2293862 RepID=UPI000E4BFF45|nr:hypothetical protein [Ruegeria sp. AD91A]AXT27070.1 hypothetical protein D1823_11075 [Ruegeria sp. AD91A]